MTLSVSAVSPLASVICAAPVSIFEKGKAVFATLCKLVAQKERPEVIRDRFHESLKELTAFLEESHKEMLSLNEEEREVSKEEFRQIKRGFRDILLYMASIPHWYSVHSYREDLARQLVASDGYARSGSGFSGLLRRGSTSEYEKIYGEIFFLELILFRKSYLTLFSIEKVKQVVRRKQMEQQALEPKPPALVGKGVSLLKSAYSYLFPPSFSEEELFSLQSLTLLHGTNARVLQNFGATNESLVPSGKLMEYGITPLSGELREGLAGNGVNQRRISGTTLDSAERAIYYAQVGCQNGFLSYTKEVSKVQNFLEEIESRAKQQTFDHGIPKLRTDLARTGIAIRRLRIEAPWTFWYYKKKLQSAISLLNQEFQKSKTTPEYKRYMPRSDDPDGSLGYQWHDHYYAVIARNIEHGIAFLKASMEDELKQPEKSSLTNKTFSIVFGSKTAHPKVHNITFPGELSTEESLALGKDIQVVFVPQRNQGEMRAYLESKGLESKVSVYTLETLRATIALSKLVAPYLADVCSAKKWPSRS